MQFKLKGKWGILISLLLMAAMVLSACQPGSGVAPEPTDEEVEPTDAEPTDAAEDTGGDDAGEPAGDDLLAAIQERGTLIVATDPAYPPQSALVEDATRAEDTA